MKKMNYSKRTMKVVQDSTMKKIQLTIKTLAALLVAGAAFTACSNDDNAVSEQPVNAAQETYTLTVKATKGSYAATRALALDGSTINATWGSGEKVDVYNDSDEKIGELTPKTTGSASADLTGIITGTLPSLDDELTLKFLSASYTSQTGTLDYIGANCDYATASVAVFSLYGGITTSTARFTNQQAIIKFTLKDKATSAAINPSALTITDGTSTVTLSDIPDATYTTNGDGVLYVAFPAAGESKTITLNTTVGSDTYTYTESGATFTNGNYYAINVKMESIPNAVDLGLPSGRLWASMNVGASSPEDYGDYFAWGETTPQSDNAYSWTSYKWCKGSESTLTKYCNDSSYGSDGFTDSKTVLDLEDDAARANWGGEWRMPTKAEFQELIDNTTSEWTTQNGEEGRKFTSKTNSNSIFLPAAGYRWADELKFAGSRGYYWSSSLYEGYQYRAWGLHVNYGYVSTNDYYRGRGHSVRPVR